MTKELYLLTYSKSLKKSIGIFSLLTLVCAGGCQVPVPAPPPRPSMIDGKFVRRMSDAMMRSLLNSKIMSESEKSPRIAVLRIRNRTRFPFDATIFSAKLRADLNSKATGRIIFLDRTRIRAIKSERSGKRGKRFSFAAGSLKKAISGADYFLAGDVRSLSSVSNVGHRSDYVHFDYYLVNAENTDIVWEDQYERDMSTGAASPVYR